MIKIQYLIEAFILWLLFTAFRLLPLDMASWLGSVMARGIGPLIPVIRVAQRNLQMAMPELSAEQRRKIINAMWDNLGRTMAELPHLPGKKLFSRMHIEGSQYLPTDGQSVFFFSGHLGNWELNAPMAFQHGVPLTLIYRAANNPYVDRMITNTRSAQCTEIFPKGPKGAFKLARAIKKGHSIALLIDQKMNDGIPVPFFGRDAMTAPAIAQLALRHDKPIIPARVIRTGGCHFKGIIYPPLQYEKTGDMDKDVMNIMIAINQMIESWIREYPEQWFWVHNRWPKA